MEKKIPQYQFLTTVLYYIYIVCFLYTLNLKKLVFIKKLVYPVPAFIFSVPLLYHCTIFTLYYVCDLLTIPNVLSIIKSIKNKRPGVDALEIKGGKS